MGHQALVIRLIYVKSQRYCLGFFSGSLSQTLFFA